jgi:tetratricopeptide (TPR) repeat protein
MRYRGWLSLFLLASSFAFAKERPKSGPKPAHLPVSTSSKAARRDFDRAMRNFEQYRLAETLQNLRAATQADPKFAQAYILIAKVGKDPDEQQKACEKAKQFAAESSAGEQLLVRWLANAQENNYLPAIAAMNDLLEKYPQDHRLAFLAGDWLVLQQRYEQAAVVLQRALTLFPNYPAALNDLGYTYAFSGEFTKAFAMMDRYVALAPNEPNPHDSYGEILRMAGKFDAALEQYRTSIRMDPNFGSEVGVADTLALMGREEDAREEYGRAEVFAADQYDKVSYELQGAVTWIREGNRKQAERSLTVVARHAHAADLARLEAEAHRVLAMYDSDPKAALAQLREADAALDEKHLISDNDRDSERARILQVRALRLAEGQDFKSAADVVGQLETMAGNSRSLVIQLCYQGAAGAVFEAQGKHAEAIAYLEEDSDDPLSMKLLWRAYSNSGKASQAESMATKLSTLNVPSAEQALVVPQFRASLVSEAGQR